MKKYFVVALALMTAMSIFLTGCGGSNSASKPAEDKKVAAEKILRVGTEPSFAPFEFQKEGSSEFTGFDMDLIRALGKEMGYKVEIVNMGFDALIPALASGTIDAAISGMSITEERRKAVSFSNPYYKSGLIVMVPKDNTTIKDYADLVGKTIAVQIGTTGANAAEAVKDAKVKSFNTNVEAALELKNGGAEAVINDSPVVDYYLAHGGNAFAKTVGPVFEAEDYGIAVKKGNDVLLNQINTALEQAHKNGEYNKIYKAWFGDVK